MTEADEKLSRLFAAETSEPDAGFVDAVDARLRRTRAARLAVRAVNVAAFVVLAVAAWFAWREAKPAFDEMFGAVSGLQMDVMGAPAPVLAVAAAAGLWFVFRRFVRAA